MYGYDWIEHTKNGDSMETILFTGARSGIQARVIEIIKKKPYQIYVTVHNEKQLKLVREYYQKDSNVHCLKLDVTNSKDLEQLKKLNIDILVNNAAIGEGGSMAEIPMNLVRSNFEVNVFSYFEVIQVVLKQMIQRKKGKIINMASLAGLIPIPYLGSYCATKASIIKMTETLKMELKDIDANIQVCLVEPGLYHTGFNQVMLDNKYTWMGHDSYFQNVIEKIRKRENLICQILEHQELHSIVKQIVKAIQEKHVKRIYRAPFLQVMGAKLYLLLME